MTKYDELLQKIDDLRTEVLSASYSNEVENRTYYCDDSVDTVVVDLYKDTYTVKAVSGYNEGVDILATMENNGNGFTCHFPSYSSVHAENYICMDYAEADYLYKMLKEYRKENNYQL